jgi:hypothetical protein
MRPAGPRPHPRLLLDKDTLDTVLSEKRLADLVERVVAGAGETPALQLATQSRTRLLLDKLRPERYVKEDARREDGLDAVCRCMTDVYRDAAFAEKFAQQGARKPDPAILGPFLGLLTPPAWSGSTPGRGACRPGRTPCGGTSASGTPPSGCARAGEAPRTARRVFAGGLLPGSGGAGMLGAISQGEGGWIREAYPGVAGTGRAPSGPGPTGKGASSCTKAPSPASWTSSPWAR